MKAAADYCADIAKALEMGPTDGPWCRHEHERRAVFDTSGRGILWGGSFPKEEAMANVALAAACHPAALRSILKAREQDAMAVAKLVEECKRLRMDAERAKLRYETLRALYPSAPSEQELDTAIDAAMGAPK